MIDWKRNNKVGIRNFNEACDKHDVVKLLFVRLLRRKYRDSSKIPIYTEYDPQNSLDDYPDIWFKLPSQRRNKKGKLIEGGADIYVVEIQEKVTKDWEKQIREKHSEVNLIIIPLKNVPNTINGIIEYLKKGDYEGSIEL